MACHDGVGIAGFPNLFIITGPGSPSVLTHGRDDRAARRVGRRVHRPRTPAVAGAHRGDAEAQEKWTDHVAEVAAFTVYPKADSWYMGANIAGKRRRFLPYIAGLDVFRGICADVAANGYRGFSVS